MGEGKKWFVFYTKARHEKKVRELLTKAGYEVFLPLQKVMRQWSDRKKKVEVPLFNSYIFVNAFEHQLNDVLQIPGVSWKIMYNGKPAVLRDEEYTIIQRFISSGLFIETSAIPDSLAPLDKVKVMDGPLAGMEGILLGMANDQKFTVALEGINQIIKVEIQSLLLKKLG
jgi:transcription termination/antitermination protein NusG